MSVPVSALEVGKCYLTNTGRVWRVIQILPDGRVLYEQRARSLDGSVWTPGMLTKPTLPAEVEIEREVPCDLSPKADGKQP